MILAPVGLAELKERELTTRVEVVAVVEHSHLSWLLVHRTDGPVGVVLNKVGLVARGCLTVELELVPQSRDEALVGAELREVQRVTVGKVYDKVEWVRGISSGCQVH